jgi:hypothetical protein
MLVALDVHFVQALGAAEGKDGTALDEVRMRRNSTMNHGRTPQADEPIGYARASAVPRCEIGRPMRLTQAGLRDAFPSLPRRAGRGCL